MKTNYHTHTTRCHHATGSDEDYVLSAIKGAIKNSVFPIILHGNTEPAIYPVSA